MKSIFNTEPLINVCKEITDGSHFSPKTTNGGYPYITVRDIENDQIDFSSCKYISESDFNTLLKNGCKPNKGDVLFSKDGTVGKVSLVNYEKDFVVLSSLAIIRPDHNLINSAYLKYILQSPTFLEEAIGKKTGVAIRRIILRNLKSIPIPLPSLSEQRRIVQILDKAFEAIAIAKANTGKNLQNTRNLFESYVQDLFYQNAKRWSEINLGEICNFVRGPFGGSLKKSSFVSNGFAVYEQQHAIYNQFSEIRYYISKQKFEEMKRFELNIHDLIMSCSGTMGKVAIVPEGIKQGIINQALLKLTPSEKVLAKYLKYWMESKAFQDSLSKYSGGAAIQNVASVKILKNIKIPLPPKQEQKNIVAKIDNIQAKTNLLHSIYGKKVTVIEELKKSLLHQAFTGQLTNKSTTNRHHNSKLKELSDELELGEILSQ